ncbi:MAG: ABC-2 family transporter protein [Cyanobacteriota bacterium]|nr:ABC-2 family transporter protein [Cyanobacteriota bacterium]
MGRYLKTLRRFWGTALASQTEYQANLLFDLLGMGGNLAGSLFVMGLFFQGGQSLGGWTWPEALVVLGVYTLLDGVSSTLLRPNLSRIVSQVQEGTLDFVLLKPIDSQFWLSTRTFSLGGLPEIGAGLLLIVWSASAAGSRPTAVLVGAAALLLGTSLTILYSLWFALATTSIWFVKTWNATEVLRAILTAGRYPITAYPQPLRLLFTVVIPVAFLTTVPAEAILGRPSWPWLLAGAGMAAACFALSRGFWRLALRFHTSASS